MDHSEKLSIVIPVFNEEGNIDQLVESLENLELPSGFELLEILFIDDGSLDQSAQKIRQRAESFAKIRLVQFERNYGQTSALSAGFDEARGDLIACLDGDLQNDPADIPMMLEKIKSGFDVVSGWRKSRKDGWLRTILSNLANHIISWLTGLFLHDYGCTLKIYRKKHLSRIKLYGEMHRFIPIYLQTVGAKICEVPVRHQPRQWGQSKYGLNRTFKVLMDLMVIRFLNRYANRPIYLFGTVGSFSVFIGILMGIYALHKKWFSVFPLLTFMCIFMGILFILLGLLAELLVRVYYESQDKPTYIIKDQIPPRS